MTGYDLDMLEQLLKSTSTIHLVGDLRQSVFDTNPQDPRLPEFRGLKMINWFRQQEESGRLQIKFSSTTWRSVQSVATFADSLLMLLGVSGQPSPRRRQRPIMTVSSWLHLSIWVLIWTATSRYACGKQ